MTTKNNQKQIERLQKQHRDMDEAIKILEMSPRFYYDDIIKLKKEKLHLKEKLDKVQRVG